MSLAWLLKLLWLRTAELDRFFLGECLVLPDCLFVLLRCLTVLGNKDKEDTALKMPIS